jgi:hypothetical protein
MPGRTTAPDPALVPRDRPRADALAIAALVTAVVAFLCGLLPVLGLILGAVGVVLGVLAKRRSSRPDFGLTALILSGVAIVANLVIDVIVVVSLVTEFNNLPAG